MRTVGLTALGALAAALFLLSAIPARLGAQTRTTYPPTTQATPCPGTIFFATQCASQPTPTPIAAPPRATPTTIPTPQPTPTAPVLVRCGSSFIPAGQPCILPTPTATAQGTGSAQPTTPGTQVPVVSPTPTRPATGPVQPPSTTAQLPASIAISGQNPFTVTIHANQPLNILHSVVIDVGPNTQATGVQVTTGTATIEGSQVIWNGFSLDTGEEASVTVSLTATADAALSGVGPPAIQSISLQALDLAGNPVVLYSDGSGNLAPVSAATCPNTSQAVLACVGSTEYTTQPFTVDGNWLVTWVFGPCQFGSGAFTLNILNNDGSVSKDNAPYTETSAGNFGTQNYQTGGTFSVQVLSVCPWNVEVQVP
jgi:hypothetical protein